MNTPDPAEVVRLRNRVAALERHNAELWACLNASDARLERVSAELAKINEVLAGDGIKATDAAGVRYLSEAFDGQYDLARQAEAELVSLQALADRCREKDWAHSAEQAARRERAEAKLTDLTARVERVRDVVYALPALPDPTNPEILFRVGQHDMAGRVKGVMGWPEKAEDRS